MTRMPVAETMGAVLGAAPIAVEGYDGSRHGPADAPVRLRLRSPKALSYLVTAPGELGMARAYVSGELDLDGDLYTALSLLWEGQLAPRSWPDRLDLVRRLDPKALRWVDPPEEEWGARRLRYGLRHSAARDAESISRHYDVSNRFYELVLGPSMTYTCACYPADSASLERAQEHKYDLVCRKLGLRSGMRLLDVGCGWGGMVLHAAGNYGVRAIGVTLSRKQAEWGTKAVADAGLVGRAEVRHGDYRDVPETGFDAVSSIGLTEHIGLRNLPRYFSFLYGKLKVGGRLLNHCITRPDNTEPAIRKGGFINRYVFPDGELEGPGYLISLMHDNGFEV